MSTFTITISNDHLSDLFFNTETRELNNLYASANGAKQRQLTDAEVRSALALDAREFTAMLGENDPELEAWLVDDYMERR